MERISNMLKRVITVIAAVAVLLTACSCGITDNADNDAVQYSAEADVSEAPAEETEIVEKSEDSEMNTVEYDYTYSEISYWDYSGMKAMMKTQAKSSVDFEAFIHSPEGKDCIVSLVNSGIYGTIDGDANIRYCESIGMRVELHDKEEEAQQWASYTPLSAQENPERIYPVLFVWHGSTNSIALTQFYGFLELAAEREWIVVIPWADNDAIYLEETDRIMNILRDNYPIDENRIYTTGFSLGGRASAHLAQERSDIFAAAAPCGVAADAHFYTGSDGEIHWSADTLEGLPWFEDGIISEEEAAAAIPVQFFGASWDPYGAMPYNSEDKIEAVNLWLQLYGLEPNQSLELSKTLRSESKNDTERFTGLKFDIAYTEQKYDETNCIGIFGDEEDCVFRIICSPDGIHWPTKAMCEYVVEFLERFSKKA